MIHRIQRYFSEKSVGYYLALAAAVLSVAGAAVYGGSFSSDEERFSLAAFILPLAGSVAFLGLSAFRVTAPFSSAALAACVYGAFLLFVSRQIIYLSDVFYGGVTLSAIASLDGGFVACVLLFLSGIGLSVAGIFLKTYKKERV